MKQYNPTSPARRQMESVHPADLVAPKKSYKPLVFGYHRSVGRNSQGRITTRHKGGGVKRLWRVIDFTYDKIGILARVVSLEYDPNRSSFVALLQYKDGERRYVLAPANLAVGSEVIASEKAPLEVGNRMPLSNIPIGTMVYNVEIERGRGGQLVRSAGTGAIVLGQEGAHTHVQLPSKEIRMVHSQNWASIGALSNPEHGFMHVGNAGRKRLKGVRPTVRGSAMNPVDHPHGGGEGKTQRGRRRGPATPWGKPAHGMKTRKKRKTSSKFILSRRKK